MRKRFIFYFLLLAACASQVPAIGASRVQTQPEKAMIIEGV